MNNMNGDEIVNSIQHYNKRKTRGGYVKKSIRRIINAYLFSICVLFILLAALCINNLFLYKSYVVLKQQYSTAFNDLKSINAGRDILSMEKNGLSEENNKLKEEYKRISRQNAEISKAINEIRRQNDELVRNNKELADDNISLQNTLKMAASVGIKPQNFTRFSRIPSRGEVDRGTYIGKFTGTAYTPSKKECGSNKGITNSGEPIVAGVSLAVDERFWPFGTVFYIRGLGYAVAMDTGSAIKGKYRFDFAVFDKKFAHMLGVRKWDVYLVKLGDGNVGNVVF